MLRILSRFFGVWLLAAALVAAVVDGAKSIAASRPILTAFGETWTILAALVRTAPGTSEPSMLPWPFDVALAWLMSAPTVAVLAVLSFLLLSAGRRRRHPLLSREFAA